MAGKTAGDSLSRTEEADFSPVREWAEKIRTNRKEEAEDRLCELRKMDKRTIFEPGTAVSREVELRVRLLKNAFLDRKMLFR